MANRALILANGVFDDPAIPDLKSPVPDGQALASLLGRDDVGSYEVTVVADQPTSVVRLQTQRFFNEAGPDDLLILYLSGHGMKDRRGNLHFVTKDTVRDALAATAVEARFFHDRMRDSQAARQVVFVDTCYSGAFAEGGSFKSVDIAVDRADFTGTVADQADEDEGIAIYTASAGNQVAQEKADADDTHQSVFTRHLIEGIATGAADPKQTGWITLEGLFSHVRRQLKREGAGQTPQRLLARLPGTVKLAKNPVAQVELPEAVQAALAGNDAKARLVAVDELLALALGQSVLMADKARAKLQELTLDDSASLASAATRALARLGPAEAVENAELAARRAEEEARLKAEAEELDRRRAQLEAEERAAKERAEQHKAEEFERQQRLYEERERERKLKEQEQDQAQDWDPPLPPPPKKSGVGRIIAIATATILGLGIVGAAIDTDGTLPEPEPVPDPTSPYGLEPPTSDDAATGPYAVTPPPEPQQQQQQPPLPEVQPAPTQNEAARLAEMISAASRPALPQAISPIMALTDVAAEGSRLIFRVQSAELVQPEFEPMWQQQMAQISAYDCQSNMLVSAFIGAGGVRVFQFTSANGVRFEFVHDRC